MGQNTSVKSCSKLFSRALFISDIKRFFFLPIIHFLICMSAPLMIYDSLYNNNIDIIKYKDIEKLQLLRESIAILSFPVYIAIGAFLVTLAVFAYLYTQKASFMMHSFPVDRKSMFVTGTLASLFMLIIPTLLATIISLCMTASVPGGAESICQSFVLFLLETVFFVGLAEFVIMCTGTIIAAPIFYGIINILIPAIETLIKYAYEPFAFGYSVSVAGIHTGFAPIAKLTTYIMIPLQYENNETGRPLGSYYENINYFLVVAIIGIIFMAISYVIYQKKHVESVGSVLPMRWTRPIMRWGVTFCAVLCITVFFDMVFFRANPSISKYRALFIIVTIVFGTISFFASQMLIQRSFRIFNKLLTKEWIAMLACFCTMAILASFDIFGVEKMIPNPEDVNDLWVSVFGTEYSLTGENMEKVMEIQRSIIENKNEIMQMNDNILKEKDIDNWDSIIVLCSYYLKNGKYIERCYYVPTLDGEEFSKQNALFSEIVDFFNSPEMIRTVFARDTDKGFSYPDSIVLNADYSHDWGEAEEKMLEFDRRTSISIENEAEIKMVTDAFLKDIDAGSVKVIDTSRDEKVADFETISKLKSDEIRYNMDVGFTSKDSRSYTTSYTAFITVDKNCKNLYAALKEAGKMK